MNETAIWDPPPIEAHSIGAPKQAVPAGCRSKAQDPSNGHSSHKCPVIAPTVYLEGEHSYPPERLIRSEPQVFSLTELYNSELAAKPEQL